MRIKVLRYTLQMFFLSSATLIFYLLAYLSESVQRDLRVYELINVRFGTGIANFTLGHLGDMVAPLGAATGALAVFICLCFFLRGELSYEECRSYYHSVFALIGVIIGASSFLIEIFNAFFPDPNCHLAESGRCPGDLSDCIVFLIPVFALIIQALRHKQKTTQFLKEFVEAL